LFAVLEELRMVLLNCFGCLLNHVLPVLREVRHVVLFGHFTVSVRFHEIAEGDYRVNRVAHDAEDLVCVPWLTRGNIQWVMSRINPAIVVIRLFAFHPPEL